MSRNEGIFARYICLSAASQVATVTSLRRVNRGSVAGLVYVRHWPLPGVDLVFTPPSPPAPPNNAAAANLAGEESIKRAIRGGEKSDLELSARKSLCLHGRWGSELQGVVPCELEQRRMPRQCVVVLTISS
ncbi:hypothetical protein TEQG_00428 [Trichophyton equinum CBS 127.97]|uniref:Uncharacterized protein n=1 Tax=Trichophyton equinum (strain ATCC MYA-4606 / CBS 127.97) TaxID=559882 RepID=F2PHK7_TRIEC|nr:hypothetical protein TEQG_00428 [Trichophyton equinum CBS 127.97]